MHTHLAIVPDTVRVAPRALDPGMVSINLLSDHVHADTCDDTGQTVHRVAGTPGHVSLMLHQSQARTFAHDLLTNLSDADRAAVIRSFVTFG